MRCFILSVSVCVIFGIWVLVTCRVGIGGDCPPSSPATPHVVPEPQLQGGNLGLADDTPGRERRQKERKDWGQAGALDTGRGLLGSERREVLPRAGFRASRVQAGAGLGQVLAALGARSRDLWHGSSDPLSQPGHWGWDPRMGVRVGLWVMVEGCTPEPPGCSYFPPGEPTVALLPYPDDI